MKKNKLIIIDGNAILHRAFHALPPTLTTKDGVMVNAVYGFTMMLFKVYSELKPDYLVLTFDRAAPTFRHVEYVEYKAHRKKQPQELYDQLELCKDMVRLFNIPIYEQDGFEADDIIGSIAKDKKLAEQNIECYIVTGDLDTLQLVDENIKVFTSKKGISNTVIYDVPAVVERYGGLRPDQLIDYKALRGDPSDNIPGVRGIGDKGAITLISEFKNLENLYKNIDSEKIKDSLRAKLIENKEDAFLSKKLSTIIVNMEIDFKLEDAILHKVDKTQVLSVFSKFGFQSLVNKIPESIISKPQTSLFDMPTSRVKVDVDVDKKNDKYYFLKSKPEYENFLKIISSKKEIVIDTETTGLNPREAKLVGMSFCFGEGEGYYLESEMMDERLSKVLRDPAIKKIGHNLKFDYSILKMGGIELQGIFFDTMIASYLLNPGSRAHSLDALSFSEFGHQKITTEEVLGEKIDKKTSYVPMDKVDPERLSQYACEDVDYTYRLYTKFVQDIDKAGLSDLLYNIEMPIVRVLAEMEMNGVKIDEKKLADLGVYVDEKLVNIDRDIYELSGVDFNINSPKQLKEVLFEKMKIDTAGLKKTKTGISTAAGELDKLKDLHPIINLIIEHRELSKLNSTYIKSLPLLISKKTGRVHTSFNQTITATGRLSSSDPNLQNIPIRTELGKKIRDSFIAEKGYKLIAADYSQIELRIVASLANDKNMIEAFNNGVDIHTATAGKINEVAIDDVTKEMRYSAKEVNFGVLYGMGAYGLAMRTGITRKEAKQFIEKYFEVYSGVKKYLEEILEFAVKNGYVETFFGRKRYLPEIVSQIAMVRKASERMAVNMPIQGTASDLMKIAMINIQKMIESEVEKNDDLKVSDVKLTLQVHDEVVLEVREDVADFFAEKVKEVMESVHLDYDEQNKEKFKVPIVVEACIGDNWGQCK